MDVDTDCLRDQDVAELAAYYAGMVTDQRLTPRLQAWSWCLAFALVLEQQRRAATARALPPDPQAAG